MSQPWNAPQREVTPEGAALSRRRWLALAAGGLGLAGAAGLWRAFRPGSDDEVLGHAQEDPPGADLSPARPAGRFRDAGRPLTAEAEAARYSNFYEFTSSKAVWRHVGDFRPAPWQVQIDGM